MFLNLNNKREFVIYKREFVINKGEFVINKENLLQVEKDNYLN